MLEDDLDPVVTGFGWWAEYPMPAEARGWVSHYLSGAISGMASNLTDAAAHLANYQEAVRKEAIWYGYRCRQARGGIPNLRDRNDIEALRDATLSSELKGFFRTVGSVFDTMAATVIWIGALEFNIVKADWGQLCTSDDSETYPRTSGQAMLGLRRALTDQGSRGGVVQDTLLQAVRGAVTAAGPAHWDQWLHAMRNTQVHRSQWTQIFVHADIRNPEAGTHRLLPRQPQLAEGHHLQSAAHLAEIMLTEDAQVTMVGVLDSIVPVVQAVTAACESAWMQRRASPMILPQPYNDRWLPIEVPAFSGYDPDHARKAVADATMMGLHPTHSKRLAALKLPSS
ncbi:hypothetical protein [Nocardia fluminea]|uniref:hypothetical protein n=1 Tax=Nocardia fluminea TaxID=134984 RepID=UPI0037A1A915